MAGSTFFTRRESRFTTVMPYPALDPMRLRVFPLAERRNLTNVGEEAAKAAAAEPPDDPAVTVQISASRSGCWPPARRGAAIMLTYGAHLIKNGAGRLLNALIDAGLVTHLATQGAGIIHDWEFAFQGQSSESVRENASAWTFGCWDETGRWLDLRRACRRGGRTGVGRSNRPHDRRGPTRHSSGRKAP